MDNLRRKAPGTMKRADRYQKGMHPVKATG
jgi:hypothetical protein